MLQKRSPRTLAWLTLSLLGLTATACSTVSAPTGTELLAEGDRVRAEMDATIDEVVGVLDPEGTTPIDNTELASGGLGECKLGFNLSARVDLGNIQEWRFPTAEKQWRMELGEELHELGWTDIEGTRFDADGPDTTMVYASYPDVVDEMILMFHPGEVADGVTMHVRSSCHPGDHRDLIKLSHQRGRAE